MASEAKNNAELLTDHYIKLQMTKSMLNNTKIFFSGQDSALGNGHPRQQFVKLLVVTDGELKDL